MKPIMAIDFEASCLPRHGRSFPIEVGIADLRGNARSWLIRPHTCWADWSWTAEAQALHGLTRDALRRDGRPAHEVLAELGEAVRGHRVIADSMLDRDWLAALASAAARPAPCRIDHVAELFDELGATPDAVATARGRADRLPLKRHRAGDDARWLAGLITCLQATREEEAEDRPLFAWGATPVSEGVDGADPLDQAVCGASTG
jgi:DNA polymerase III epsilon subunit-like protein